MLLRALSLSLSLAFVSVVQAGGVVTLVSPGPIAPGATGTVEVQLSQSPTGSDQLLRMIQFDVNASDAALTLDLPVIHDIDLVPVVISPQDILFWSFTGVPACDALAASCGAHHFVVDELTTTIAPGAGVFSATFGSDTQLAASPTFQRTLPGDGSAVTVGYIDVTCPSGAPGVYSLDIVNAGDPDLDKGGQVRLGFGCPPVGAPCADPITAWRASAGELTGGTLSISCGGTDANLVSSAPACGVSLWRSANNFALLTFDKDVTAPTGAGEIEIRELQAGGALGPDLSGSFTFSNDSPTVVRVTENGSVLTHRTWYAITASGGSWSGVADFKLDVVLQVGDAIANGRVLGADASAVNTGIPCFVNCPVRLDINGDSRVLGSDFSVVNTSIPSFPVPKPSGHTCLP